MIFKHILVPYDGSNTSAKALDKAIQFVKADPATQLTVAHVINLQPLVVADITFVQPEGYQEQVKKQGNELLDKIKQRLGELPHTNVVVLAGSPAEAIVDYSDNSDCDLIIMGSRGLGAIREFMVGSVSHNVLQHARIPVLIMK
ncbi:universal stress protein [Cohnella silvisoli]|uniref:Universal stress protein n=1 Tax=Cohnella silvisoli TaxID=2873699 RepID=A0ABV1KRU5_9BACL|nr:universal stress protein [Cohnella silvisoli]MCD9022521.1 universal stress protein [Cohnella silvisoli]